MFYSFYLLHTNESGTSESQSESGIGCNQIIHFEFGTQIKLIVGYHNKI